MEIYRIFDIATESEFNSNALEIFRFQYQNNPVYRQFCTHLGKTDSNIRDIRTIPFLPIEFFKSKRVITAGQKPEVVFTSSGTTGANMSKHHVTDLKIYEKSYSKTFEHFYGSIKNICVLALLPSYLEREGSSLIYMVNDLINKSGHPDSGFYLADTEGLSIRLKALDKKKTNVLLIGVSFALLDMAEKHQMQLKNVMVMETGGMKGRRKEMIREQLHTILKKGFGVDRVHSEYGMTELLSQAYSKGNGIFETPSWMKVLVRDAEDPLTLQPYGKTGGINIIDLANLHSCSFIATQDLGKVNEDGSFEVLGRFDHSIRTYEAVI